MMSSEIFDVYGGNGGADGQYDFDLEIVNYKKIISNLEKLKSMRDIVIQDMKKDEDDFVPKIHSLISDWEGQYPIFRKILRPKEMDWLLLKCVEDEDVINFVMKSGYKDELEMDEDGKPLLNRSTPLHYAAFKSYDKSLVRKLFEIYDRFDVNYIDEIGCTHFHAACKYGFDDIVQKFLELGQNPNILTQKSAVDLEAVIPPLHVALERNCRNVVELLLKNGADPNLATGHGRIPLHVIAMNGIHGYELADLFFKICDDENLTVRVNSQDHWGKTPLYRALEEGDSYLIELLLRRGADPNLANEAGLTPLHIISERGHDDDDGLMEVFFEVNDEIGQTVLIDARDKEGNTPLHLALSSGHEDTIKLLLRRDANPHLVNEEGSTPLHIISKRDEDDGLMKLFFEIIDDVQKTVKVDAVDKSGHTPLQWAVASLLPSAIDVLLDNGANLSRLNFIFPTVGHFDEKYKLQNHNRTIWFKLKFAYDTMAVVERLEKRGYELDRSGAMAIMNAFVKHELFKRTANFDESRYNDEEFVKEAKEIMVKPNLSFYDMISLRPETAEKLITSTEMYDFVESNKYYKFSETYRDACGTYLCELLPRRFFKKWALDPLLELTNYKLPILCCDKIIEKLQNEDLRRVCLAATDENS